MFPFSLKPKPNTKANTGLAALEHMGSSLMSARGYDSDAQCIASPQHDNHIRASPKSPGIRRTGLHELIEHSREQNNSQVLSGAQDYCQSDSTGIPLGLHYIPTPPSSLRGRTDMTHNSPAAEGTAEQPVRLIRDEGLSQQNASSSSLPRIHINAEELAPPHRNRNREGIIAGSSEILQDLVADWANYVGSNPNDFRTASSASLAAQDHGIMVSKRRQPTSSPRAHPEARVPHLGDLDLSHRLAGTSMGSAPPSNNPSMAELPRPNRYGRQMISQDNLKLYEGSGSLTITGNESQTQDLAHPRDASSFYSRQSSIASGNATPAVQSLRIRAPNAFNNLPNIHTQMGDKSPLSPNEVEPGTDVLRSKFVEQLDMARPRAAQACGIPDETNGGGPQRRVSPGWMTGGRRVGYGYDMVDNAEDHSPTKSLHRDDPGSMSKSFPGHEANTSSTYRRDVVPLAQPITPDQGYKRSNSRSSPMTMIQVDTKGGPILTPTMWAKMRSHSIRRDGHVPLAENPTHEGVTPTKNYRVDPDKAQQNRSPTSPKVDYVEGTDETFLGRWVKASRSTSKRAQPAKDPDPRHVHHIYTPEIPPRDGRRFSMDQTNRPPSVYFDPSSNKSADKLNREPSRSRSGRWILRFSRNRDSKRRSNIVPKEPSQELAVQYQERAASGLERADSTRSDAAEELASAYQDCIEMPGAFYGSRWASRTSLVVDAEE